MSPADHHAGARAMVDVALNSVSRAQVARDDVVDALVLALAARLDPEDLETLPPEPDHAQIGRRMAITCPRTRAQ